MTVILGTHFELNQQVTNGRLAQVLGNTIFFLLRWQCSAGPKRSTETYPLLWWISWQSQGHNLALGHFGTRFWNKRSGSFFEICHKLQQASTTWISTFRTPVFNSMRWSWGWWGHWGHCGVRSTGFHNHWLRRPGQLSAHSLYLFQSTEIAELPEKKYA